ncbi:MAG: aromatic ring-hydroxylating dioxygenase subunit alpha [Pseudomonadota bacterium]
MNIAMTAPTHHPFPLDQWYIAAFAWELKERPLGRTLLNQPVVLFRGADGSVGALEDRCCHRALPLSCGTVEPDGLRCGYHGLLFAADGKCIDIPGQDAIPAKARVRAYHVREQDQIIWMWFGVRPDGTPPGDPPAYPVHSDPRYAFGGDVYHYDAPYQLIHDNLLDLSHLGYVHLRTIGGNARLHMNAPTRVEADGDIVRVVRHMPDSVPPPTYTSGWPFKGNVDRWQEIEFHVSHLRIWTGAADVGSEALDNPGRGGFHLRGLHGITPETESTSHYFWTVANSVHPDMPDTSASLIEQSALTFVEDKVVIEAQYRNMQRFPGAPMVDIHVDVGTNRARRIVARLVAQNAADAQTDGLR